MAWRFQDRESQRLPQARLHFLAPEARSNRLILHTLWRPVENYSMLSRKRVAMKLTLATNSHRPSGPGRQILGLQKFCTSYTQKNFLYNINQANRPG
jgi:hypothetical protein